MTTITQEQYTRILTNCAKNDMASARRDVKLRRDGVGTLIICDTKLGNVELFYNSQIKRYSITGRNVALLNVTAARIVEFLVANYNVTLTDTVVV